LPSEPALEQIPVSHDEIPLPASRRQVSAVRGGHVPGQVILASAVEIEPGASVYPPHVLLVDDGGVGDQGAAGGEQHPESRQIPQRRGQASVAGGRAARRGAQQGRGLESGLRPDLAPEHLGEGQSGDPLGEPRQHERIGARVLVDLPRPAVRPQAGHEVIRTHFLLGGAPAQAGLEAVVRMSRIGIRTRTVDLEAVNA
jgi:hypothetical protein